MSDNLEYQSYEEISLSAMLSEMKQPVTCRKLGNQLISFWYWLFWISIGRTMILLKKNKSHKVLEMFINEQEYYT